MNSYKFVILTSLIIMGLSGTPLASAHVGTITSLGTDNPPTLDGAIGEVEWADANFYSEVGTGGAFDIYLKHDNDFFYIGIRVRDNTQYEEDEFTIRFDEGDDGGYGSGSGDEVLNVNQEEMYVVKGSGWRMDGYYELYELQKFWSASADNPNFNSGVVHYGDYYEFELRIPYQGTEGAVNDLSDLTINTKDVIGIMFAHEDVTSKEPGRIYFQLIYYPSQSDTLNPTTWVKLEFDSDRDGLSDNEEAGLGTSLYDSDTDGDNLSDYEEVKIYHTDFSKADTDNDNLRDGLEVHGWFITVNGLTQRVTSNPMSVNSDEDNLTDWEEYHIYFTNPSRADTDGDGLSDKQEVELGLSPLKADSDGDFWGDSTDPWPTNAFLPNLLIILPVIICIVAVVWWKRKK